MFWRPKHMHIATAEDDEIESFLAREINVLEAFCGAVIARGWIFTYGGSKPGAPICPDCAIAAGWDWDDDLQDHCVPA